MKKKTGWKLFVLVLLAGAVVVAAWLHFNRDKAGARSGSATAVVARRRFASTVLATGAIRPQVGAEVKVGARISGRVERLHVNIGDRVAKGQILAELDSDELEAQVATRHADLLEAQARLAGVVAERPEEINRARATIGEAQAALTLAQQQSRRMKLAYERDATTSHEVDIAAKELGAASARLALTEASLKLIDVRSADSVNIAKAVVSARRASLDGARARLAYATIQAPIAGTVASVSTQEGETVSAGLSAPTFVTIIDLTRLQADTFVDEVDIGRIKLSQQALLTVDTFPDRDFEGKVAAIYPKAVIQDNVVNYDVVINITSPYEGLLRPEMTASVTIFLQARDNVLAVPAKAVKRLRGATVVYVPGDGGKPKAQPVKVGWREGQWIEIVSGLTDGQTVLLDAPPAAPGD